MLLEYLKDTCKIDKAAQKDKELFIFVRGYIIYENKLYVENECRDFIRSDYKQGKFDSAVPGYNGCWQILIYDAERHELILANDRWGTYPLFKVEKDEELYVSDEWKDLLPYGQKELNEQSAFEMASFGYVLGDKTLVDGMYDVPSHSIERFTYVNGKLQTSKHSYWQLRYKFNSAKEKEKEKEFAELWQSQLSIYAEAVRRLGNACYIPMSGGLDSRLLAGEFDKHGISIYAMTFGSSKNYDEIDAAIKVVDELHHSAGHHLEYLNEDSLAKLAESENHCNRLTSGYFGQMYLDHYAAIKDKCKVIMPGFSGDFLGGSLIRYRMLSWKKNKDAIDYILDQRSAPMVRAFAGDQKYKHYIHHAINDTFPDDADVISNYVRWFTEHDIRRYLMRSVQNENNAHGFLILPFFDYKFIDFFLELPVKLLINKRLYTNTQIKYLYRHHPELIRIERAKPKGKIRRVGNAFFAEYGNKLKNRISKLLRNTETRTQWDQEIDWYKIYGNMELPDFMDPELIRHPNLKAKPTYIKFFDAVSKVYKEMKS